MKHIPRLYVSDVGDVISLSEEQKHHLINVLKCRDDAIVHVFNARIGEWQARLKIAGRGKRCDVQLLRQQCVVEPYESTEKALAFCIIKPHRLMIMLEKCCELGIRRFLPIISDYTNEQLINVKRCQDAIVAAIEQSGRIHIPVLDKPRKLSDFCAEYRQRVVICDGGGESGQINQEDVFLIGPEGGFSHEEYNLFCGMRKYKLCDGILRSETAAIAAATVLSIAS